MPGLATRRPRISSLRRARTLTSLLAAAALSACASARHANGAPQLDTRVVVVQNYSPDYTTVYLGSRGTTWRLGELSGYGSGAFPVPRTALADAQDVYLVARRLAGPTFRSETFPLPSGATAVWTIEGQASLSHVALR